MLKIKKRYKNLIINLFLLLFVLVSGLYITELFLDLFFPQGNPLWEYDPLIGIKMTPNKCSRYISPEYNTELCVNSEGFRDIEHTINKDPSITRIAILGDSFTAAREVEREERFSDLIQKRCEDRIEVLNFGVGGQGTAAQLLTFKHYVKKYRPDYTLLIIFPEDDVSDNYLPLENRDYIPTYQLNDLNEIEYIPFKKPPLIGNPLLSSISQKLFPNIFSLAGKTFRNLSSILKGQKDGLPKYLYVYSINESEEYKIAWKIEERLLEEFGHEVEDNGSVFIMINLFSSNQVNNFKRYQDKEVVHDFDKNKPNIKLNELAKKLGIINIDLLGKMDTNKPYEDLFFYNDQHLTKDGHKVVADLILSGLEEKAMIC